MDNMTENTRKFFDKERQFSSEDLPKIRKMVTEVTSGRINQREAAERYNVTRYQVRKWVDHLQDQLCVADADSIDEIMK